jgi:tRNA A37 threonylcarbamoyladenosine synthetase subunit TsaC/SUA5/YrdC
MNVDEIPESIKPSVDFIVDAGQLNNQPSKIIDLTSNEPKVLRE